MILVFTKTRPDKDYVTNQTLSSIEIDPGLEFAPAVQALASFFAPSAGMDTSCTYPLNIRELFPYWLRLSENGDSILISLTQEFYKWLSCNNTDINTLSFFRLEDLIDLEHMPVDLVEHLSNTYLNSLTTNTINNVITPEKAKQIIDNIRVNLYSKKGTEASFKYVINEFFGVEPDKISVSYPKRYVLRLNGGRYPWMRDNLNSQGDYSVNIDDFYPQLTGSYLNYSVLYDNDLWQEHSYVVNTSGVAKSQYEAAVRPLLHPAGMKDFFDVRRDIFNQINDISTKVQKEIPVFANYALYLLGSNASIGHTFGCSGAYGGVTGYPIYKFPSWDVEISAKYYSGMTFGQINIGDFLYLSPVEGNTYPNSGLTC